MDVGSPTRARPEKGAARAVTRDDAGRVVEDEAKAVDGAVKAAAVVRARAGAARVEVVEARGRVDVVRVKAVRAVVDRHPVRKLNPSESCLWICRARSGWTGRSSVSPRAVRRLPASRYSAPQTAA